MRRNSGRGRQMFDGEPVLAVCGWSGSGKTTVLESVIPRLVNRGLRVAAVKHDAHGISIDRPDKDSDRLFRAGASVHLRGPGELVWRGRERPGDGLEAAVLDLLRNHDLVVVEGHKSTPLPKVWCASAEEGLPPEAVEGVQEILPWNGSRVDVLERLIDQRLLDGLHSRTVFGGVMVGGASRRMGEAKHLVQFRGRAMIEHVVDVVGHEPLVPVILGQGIMPDSLGHYVQLVDAPDCGRGPMAALLTAFRWAPRASWVACACDMPYINPEALKWLLDHRRPGRWAVVPKRSNGHFEPLLALYEPQAAWLLAEQFRSGRWALHHIGENSEVHTPTIPDDAENAWTNLNTPKDLAALDR